MKLIATNKSEQNVAAIDPWTLVHLSMGLASGLTELPFRSVMGAAIAYEIVEQWGQRTKFGQRLFRVSGPESPSNVVMDIVTFAGGYWLGQRWNRSRDERFADSSFQDENS